MAAFVEKLAFVTKALSLSRGRLGAELGVSKSVISRWFSGARAPTSTNLAAITALVAQKAPGFSLLDWDSDLESLAERLGVERAQTRTPDHAGLSPFVLEQIRLGTESRGAAYEGFFRSTRPIAAWPGRYTHDLGMIRLDADGKLRLVMRNGDVFVDAWMAPMHNHLFCIGAERTSGSLVFGAFNGAPRAKVTVVDGLVLTAIFDLGRTLTSTAIIFERIGDLSGDIAADEARFAGLAAENPATATGSVDATAIPESIRAHLVRDIGPMQLALGGDWLLQMPVARSLSV